jgi:hypothetical protein
MQEADSKTYTPRNQKPEGFDDQWRPVRVLVVDGEQITRKLLSQVLKSAGYEVVEKVYKGKIGEKLNEAMITNGNLRILGLSRRGARLLTANIAIPSPVEVKGLKLRVPEIPQWVTVWKEVGALPTPVAGPRFSLPSRQVW